MTVIDRILNVVGSQKTLAIELKITPQAVNEWVSSKRDIPPRHVLKIENLTGISRSEIRPDIFGSA